VELSLTGLTDSGEIRGTFSFYNSYARGSYSVTGAYDRRTNTLRVDPAGWIQQPPAYLGYSPAGFLGSPNEVAALRAADKLYKRLILLTKTGAAIEPSRPNLPAHNKRRLFADDARRKLGAHWDRKTLPPLGDGMTYLVQSEGQGAHPVDAQGVDRIRRQRQRQKLIGFLLVAVEKLGVPGTSHGLRDFE
jgi:hypothetical protein